MNPELRDKLFKVLSQPQRVEMHQWTCGTTACIAGWTLLLSGYKRISGFPFKDPNGKTLEECEIPFEAAKLLGIDDEIGGWLFYMDGWPEDLKKRYEAGDHATAAEALERALEGRL